MLTRRISGELARFRESEYEFALPSTIDSDLAIGVRFRLLGCHHLWPASPCRSTN
jgi:hypothetical protein